MLSLFSLNIAFALTCAIVVVALVVGLILADRFHRRLDGISSRVSALELIAVEHNDHFHELKEDLSSIRGETSDQIEAAAALLISVANNVRKIDRSTCSAQEG